MEDQSLNFEVGAGIIILILFVIFCIISWNTKRFKDPRFLRRISLPAVMAGLLAPYYMDLFFKWQEYNDTRENARKLLIDNICHNLEKFEGDKFCQNIQSARGNSKWNCAEEEDADEKLEGEACYYGELHNIVSISYFLQSLVSVDEKADALQIESAIERLYMLQNMSISKTTPNSDRFPDHYVCKLHYQEILLKNEYENYLKTYAGSLDVCREKD